LQAGGQGFESPHVHQIPLQKAGLTSGYRPVLISFYRDFTNDTSRTRSTKSKARGPKRGERTVDCFTRREILQGTVLSRSCRRRRCQSNKWCAEEVLKCSPPSGRLWKCGRGEHILPREMTRFFLLRKIRSMGTIIPIVCTPDEAGFSSPLPAFLALSLRVKKRQKRICLETAPARNCI